MMRKNKPRNPLTFCANADPCELFANPVLITRTSCSQMKCLQVYMQPNVAILSEPYHTYFTRHNAINVVRLDENLIFRSLSYCVTLYCVLSSKYDRVHLK